ncbi:hypothetical protein E1267_32185 [Nonomuraea longispora]|uniref:Uncharacterized protein n=1 Tax=Nonomuraea longispora TaxID=1848320 RepID=A0A4R4N0R8_9ACTN|nr:hypothetical protein E1267_32185 [Nonomuraea longispora]
MRVVTPETGAMRDLYVRYRHERYFVPMLLTCRGSPVHGRAGSRTTLLGGKDPCPCGSGRRFAGGSRPAGGPRNCRWVLAGWLRILPAAPPPGPGARRHGRAGKRCTVPDPARGRAR